MERPVGWKPQLELRLGPHGVAGLPGWGLSEFSFRPQHHPVLAGWRTCNTGTVQTPMISSELASIGTDTVGSENNNRKMSSGCNTNLFYFQIEFKSDMPRNHLYRLIFILYLMHPGRSIS